MMLTREMLHKCTVHLKKMKVPQICQRLTFQLVGTCISIKHRKGSRLKEFVADINEGFLRFQHQFLSTNGILTSVSREKLFNKRCNFVI
jgi:hypothetical protein